MTNENGRERSTGGDGHWYEPLRPLVLALVLMTILAVAFAARIYREHRTLLNRIAELEEKYKAEENTKIDLFRRLNNQVDLCNRIAKIHEAELEECKSGGK